MSNLVIHDHDGHIDDLISFILLYLAPSIDLQVVGITSGDSYVDDAFRASINIATYLEMENVEIAKSPELPTNPFPESWRKESSLVANLPIFSQISHKRPYQDSKCRNSILAYADCIKHASSKVTIVTTGPLTNLGLLIEQNPKLVDNIKEIIIMGGAINVPGNVEFDNYKNKAEWNIFANPLAFKTVLNSNVNIKLIPLDVTNLFPLNKDILAKLEQISNKVKAARLSTKLWSLVSSFEYYYWDTLTSVAAIDASIFKFKTLKIDVVTSGSSCGRTYTSLFGGRNVEVALDVDKNAFEKILVETLSL